MRFREFSAARHRFPRCFWLYLAGAGLAGAGFTDFPLMAFHFQQTRLIGPDWIPVLYSLAMGISGAGSLLFGRLFDRFGFNVILILTLASAAFAPFVFFGGVPGIIVGVCLWGLGMGVHESIIPAAVAPMVGSGRRASAYGTFTSAYGVAWFLGSTAIGVLYDHSMTWTVAFCVGAELLAVPFFVLTKRTMLSPANMQSLGTT